MVYRAAISLSAIFVTYLWPGAIVAQELTVGTVTRPPFSMVEDGVDTGFSIDLMTELAADLGAGYRVRRFDNFGDMLRAVESGEVDAAIANISITAGRESLMDFSQPIFESGLQIMIPGDAKQNISLFRALYSWQLFGAILIAFALLLLVGMVMWWAERRSQSYFDKPAKEAIFPAFWWALNLVVNGGFEERVPRTIFGRLFAVLMVVSSLFVVSLFVARITSVMTVEAISTNINSISDLRGQQLATIEGSTASVYLRDRNLSFAAFDGLVPLLAAFEDGSVDAVFFDAPILAFYVLNSRGGAQLAGPVVQRENYGIALPSGSELSESINQSILKLREDGSYDAIYNKWFGGLGE